MREKKNHLYVDSGERSILLHSHLDKVAKSMRKEDAPYVKLQSNRFNQPERRRWKEAKQNAQVAGAEREGMKKRISEIQQFLAEQQQDITEYDEQLVRRLIEKIKVYNERVTVEFKSGTSVDVRR